MKLARQGLYLSWAAAVAVTATLATTAVTIARVADETAQIQAAQQITRHVTHFRFLLIAASSYPGQAEASQWAGQLGAFKGELASHPYSDVEEAILIARERENAEVVGTLFARLDSINRRHAGLPPAGSTDAELRAVTVSGLNVTTQEMVDDGFELMRMNRSDLQRAQNIAVAIVLVDVLVLALLVGLSVLIIRRKVLVPVMALQAMTAAVAEGRLDTRLQLPDNNELGALANTFNAMTASLQSASLAKLQEITQRQLAQVSLERSLAQLADKSAELLRAKADLQTIIDHTPALVVYWDAHLVNRFANRAYEDWFGLSPEQMNGRHMREVIGEERFADIEVTIHSVLHGNSEMFERHLTLADGRERDALFSYFPDIQNGQVQGFYAFVSDITKLKLAQAAESEAQALVRSVVEAARDFSIIATTLDGTITLFSSGAERLLGYPASAMVGLATPALFHLPAEIEHRAAELSTATGLEVSGFAALVLRAREGGSESRDWTYRRADGTLVAVNLTVAPLLGASGAPVGYLGIAKDIGKEKETLAALAQARDAAEAASETKSRFLANMSHEIRTPMHAVLGLLQLLSNLDMPSLQRGYVDKTVAAATTLLHLLNDILDVSKIDAGKLTLDIAPISLDALAASLALMAAPLARDKDIDLLFVLEPDLPDMVRGDLNRLRQVLLNLLSNAIKFTQHGEVRLHIGRAAERGATLAFSVSDTGIGIEADQLHHIFDAFSQAEASTARRFGGSGLGLTISRELIALMGGQLGVISRPGQGSRFAFSLDLPPIAGDRTRPAPGPRRQALVIDDHEGNGELMVRSGLALGWKIDAVPSAAAVISDQVALAGVELLFLDAACLAEDNAALAALSARARANGCRIVLMGLDQAGAEELARRRGVLYDGFLSKPVMRQSMRAAAERVLLAPPDAAQTLARGRLAGLRVLIVDDIALNRLIACELLAMEGCSTDSAGDGDEALARLAGAERYDAVLMDVQMPGRDGLDTTRALRRLPHLAGLPVIAMTANAMPGDRDNCLSAGMNDYEPKPIDIDRLVATLLRHARAPLAGAAVATPASVADERGAGLADARAALARMGGNTILFRRMVQRFEADAGVLAAAILARLDEGDAAAAAREAHSLRGIAGTVGAGTLAACAARLEQDLRRTPASADRRAIEAELQRHLRTGIMTLAEAVEILAPSQARTLPFASGA